MGMLCRDGFWLGSYCSGQCIRLVSAIQNFDVPRARAPTSRHSVGTCHRRFAMARLVMLRFALFWFYWFSLFLCVGFVVGLSDCRIAGLSDCQMSECQMSDCFGNGFPQLLGES